MFGCICITRVIDSVAEEWLLSSERCWKIHQQHKSPDSLAMRVTEGKKHDKKNGAATGTDGVKGTGKGDGHCYFSLP